MYTTDRISLKQRVLNASAWSLAGYALNQVIRLGSNLLMTRLLVPQMFGIIAIAMIVNSGLQMLSDIGLQPSVIQSNRGHEPEFLNTAWVIQILRGIVLFLIAQCLAIGLVVLNHFGFFPQDTVYREPVLPQVIAVMSFTILILSFQSTKLFEAGRTLSLGRITQMEFIAQIFGLACMLGWVYFDRSVWVLVAGNLCGTLARTTISHIWLPGTKNRWQWEAAAFREIVHFGKWIFVSSMLWFLVKDSDLLLLGGMVDATLLGAYTLAVLIFDGVAQMMVKIITNVSFPAFSEISRERPAELKAGYYRFHMIIAPCAYFCAGALVISGPTLIGLLYDSRYAAAGWMLQILAVALMTVGSQGATQLFMALGIPRIFTYLAAIRLVTLFVFTPLGFLFFGVSGAIWGIVLSYFSWLPVATFCQIQYGLFDLRKELMVIPSLLVGIIAGNILNFVINV